MLKPAKGVCKDWIKMRTDLFDDPRIISIRRRCNLESTYAAIGAVYRFWSIVDDHSSDGSLPGVQPTDIDERIFSGFSEAMREVGWLEIAPDGSVVIPRFDKHMGDSAKVRAQNAERQRQKRLRDDVTDLSRNQRDILRDNVGTRERGTGTGREYQSSGPGGELSFAAAAAQAVAEVDSQPVPVRSGPGEKSFPWKAWDEVSNAIDIPLPAMIGKAMSGQVSRALKVPSKGARNALSLADVQHVGEWLTWQATQDWPYRQPVTKAAFVALVAVILAKRDSAPEQPGAAVIALLMGKPTNSRNEPVDRAAEWRQAKARAPDALALVEKLLNPSAAPPKATAADPKKDNAAAELAALNERHGPTLDSMGRDALLNLVDTAPEARRPQLIRSINAGHVNRVRTALLRLLAQRAAS